MQKLSMVNAAFEILRNAGVPLHYKEITRTAIEKGLINSSGLTPEASLLSALNRENSRRIQRNEIPRFESLDDGVYGLVEWRPTGIELQIQEINRKTREKLRQHLTRMPPKAFEELIGKLLISLGFDEDTVEVTGRSGDGGIDVIGVMEIEDVTRLDVAVQVKRVKANIPPDRITALRGSLMPNQRGIFVTTSEFTRQAVIEASALGKSPISLVGGNQLLDLLFQHEIGVVSREHKVFDLKFEDIPETPLNAVPMISGTTSKIVKQVPISYPLRIFARFRGDEIEAILYENGQVEMKEELHSSVSGAGMAATGWKSCNGWRFWFFVNPSDNQIYSLDVLRNWDA